MQRAKIFHHKLSPKLNNLTQASEQNNFLCKKQVWSVYHGPLHGREFNQIITLFWVLEEFAGT
jgi:hypothetical protein